ncbi:hypothetical protein I2I11_17380 [Pontibacter sp. 172403-2]|uniref:hypothetical protein n=1 Tax=Pontibacter rufus TaxID=2791028 RepID=UPI0018AFFE37|nr:hypothetical protein [Pontibacter sp. 172403-2]MBF9255074.1 hypothetical protein [Pontibacter sp. 172403-2]
MPEISQLNVSYETASFARDAGANKDVPGRQFAQIIGFQTEAIIEQSMPLFCTSMQEEKPMSMPLPLARGRTWIPEPNLFNKAGLPASPFQADTWPPGTYGKK